MIGTSKMITQAPWVNFVIPMMMSTTSERKAPNPLMNMPRRQCGSRRVQWCLAIPACESVKLVNTPIA